MGMVWGLSDAARTWHIQDGMDRVLKLNAHGIVSGASWRLCLSKNTYEFGDKLGATLKGQLMDLGLVPFLFDRCHCRDL